MRVVKSRVAVIEGDLLDAKISLAALGLAAQISSRDGEGLDLDALQSRYPDCDLLALADELVTTGIFVVADPQQGPPFPPPSPGYVYVMAASAAIKIGVTRNVAVRLKSLQVGNPDKLRLVFSEHVSNCIFVEQAAHAKLSATRKSGEWFACTEQEAVAAVKREIEKLK